MAKRSLYYDCMLFNHCPFGYECLKCLRKYGFIIWSVRICYALKRAIEQGLVEVVREQ